MLHVLDHLKSGLLNCEATELDDFLGGPTLIHLKGELEAPLFVSVLQHGNEYTGFEALKRVLKTYTVGGGKKTLTRSLAIFIGNTKAAKFGKRSLETQVDFNRVWPTTETSGTPEHKMMDEIRSEMKSRNVFASVDFHNNTGLNPHYGCVTKLDPDSVQLASMFSDLVVYYQVPLGTQAGAFSEICPSVVLECGQPGAKGGASHAAEYLQILMDLKKVPQTPLEYQDAEIMHTIGKVTIEEGLSLGFDQGSDLVFERNLDQLNFQSLSKDILFLTRSDQKVNPIKVFNEDGKSVFDDYFVQKGTQIFMKAGTIPSMITMDLDVIRQDCLCYVMEKYPLHK